MSSPRPDSNVGLTPTFTAAGRPWAHSRLELVVPREKARVAARALAEAEVLADRHLGCAELPYQDLLDELLRALLREVAVERNNDQLVDAKAVDQVALDRERVEQLGHRLRMEDGKRVRVEREHRVAVPDHGTMAQVDAVEGADG